MNRSVIIPTKRKYEMSIGCMYLMEGGKNSDFTTEFRKAIKHYNDKYGRANLVWVHESLDVPVLLDGIEIRKSRNIGKMYLWIGVKDAE